MSLYDFCELGLYEEVDNFLKNDVSCINKKGKFAQTPLHFAVISPYRDINIIKLLLSKGADPNIADCASTDWTPLHLACCSDNSYLLYEIVELLLDNNANPNVKDYKGKTPLYYATNSLKIRELLLKRGANPNIKDSDGWTPLDCICRADIGQLLLKYGAIPLYPHMQAIKLEMDIEELEIKR